MGEEQSPETKFALHELRISNVEKDGANLRETLGEMRRQRDAERWWIIVTLIGAFISIGMQILPMLLKGVGK